MAQALTTRQQAALDRIGQQGADEQACLDKIEQAFLKAEEFFGRTFERPRVAFSNRMKTTAGRATWKWQYDPAANSGVGSEDHKITLSAELLRRNGQVFIDRTPGHEAAHIIAIQQFGTAGNGHGKNWKLVMRVIGQRAERCHNMKVAPTKPRQQYAYRATCGTVIKLKAGRHVKVCNGASYVVRSTGGRITREGYLGWA